MRKIINILAVIGVLAGSLGPAFAAPRRPSFCAAFERLWSDREALDAASDEQIDLWVYVYNKYC